MVLWKHLLSAREQPKGKVTVKNYWEIMESRSQLRHRVGPWWELRRVYHTQLWPPSLKKNTVGRVSEKSDKGDQIQRIFSI